MNKLVARNRKQIRSQIQKKAKEFKLSGKLKPVDLHFTFTNRSGDIKNKEIIFLNVDIDTSLIREILTSFHLSYAKCNDEKFVIKFNIRLFSQAEVEDYPFDRNNDVAYLHFKKYCKQYYKIQKDAFKINLDKFIKDIV